MVKVAGKTRPLGCPFCGGKPKIARNAACPPELPNPWFTVDCRRQNACSAWPSVMGDTRAEAVANWNRRDAAKELATSELMMRQFLATILRRIGGSAFLDALHPEDRDPKIQIILRRGYALAEVRVGR